MAEFYNRVAPRSRPEDIPDVCNGVAQGLALFQHLERVAESATCPCWPSSEELVQRRDGVLDGLVAGVQWRTGVARLCRDRLDVVRDQVCLDFGRFLGVCCGGFTCRVD